MRSFGNAPDRTGRVRRRPRPAESRAEPSADFVAASRRMRALVRDAAGIARFEVPVLIEGETGTGKELLARFVHRASPRRPRPLVAVNCAAIPDELLEAEFFGHARGAFTGAAESRAGLLEAAEGGTLFLDEVAELSPRAQSLLLRALQEREFRRVGETRVRRADFRLVSATHRPLAERVAGGLFRADLFYRVAVARLRLPPLRERGDEIREITGSLLARLAARYRIPEPSVSEEALAALAARSWPGNIRELESALSTALLRRPGVSRLEAEAFAHLPAPAAVEAAPAGEAAPAEESLSRDAVEAADAGELAAALSAFERLVLLRAIRRAAGRRAVAARRLGITRQGLWRKLRRHGIR